MSCPIFLGIFVAKMIRNFIVPKQEIVEKNTLENLCSRLHQSFTKQDHFKVESCCCELFEHLMDALLKWLRFPWWVLFQICSWNPHQVGTALVTLLQQPELLPK